MYYFYLDHKETSRTFLRFSVYISAIVNLIAVIY
jgi:hypothetical protein